MPKDITEPPYKHKETLFTINSHPIHFYMRPCCERRKLKGLIEHGGGILDGKITPDCIRLAPDGVFIGEHETISTDFIIRSVLVNKPLNTADFILTKPVMDGKKVVFDNEDDFDNMPARSTKKKKKQWNKFTYREDVAMLKYMENHKAISVSGYAIYKEMEHKKIVTGHTVQSMNNRFRKYIIRQLDKYQSISEDFKAFLRSETSTMTGGTSKKIINNNQGSHSDTSQSIHDSEEDDDFGLPRVSPTRKKALNKFGPNAKSCKQSWQQKKPSNVSKIEKGNTRSVASKLEDTKSSERITRTSINKGLVSNGSFNAVEKRPPLNSEISISKKSFLRNFELKRTSPSTQKGPDLSKNESLSTKIEGPVIKKLPKLVIDDTRLQLSVIQSSDAMHKSSKTILRLKNSSAKMESSKRVTRMLSNDKSNFVRQENNSPTKLRDNLQSEPHPVLSPKISTSKCSVIGENQASSSKVDSAKDDKHSLHNGDTGEAAISSEQIFETVASEECDGNSNPPLIWSPVTRKNSQYSAKAEDIRPKANAHYGSKTLHEETSDSYTRDLMVLNSPNRSVSSRHRAKRSTTRKVAVISGKSYNHESMSSYDEHGNSVKISKPTTRNLRSGKKAKMIMTKDIGLQSSKRDCSSSNERSTSDKKSEPDSGRNSRRIKSANLTLAKHVDLQNRKHNSSNSNEVPMSEKKSESSPRRSSRRGKVTDSALAKEIDLRNSKRDSNSSGEISIFIKTPEPAPRRGLRRDKMVDSALAKDIGLQNGKRDFSISHGSPMSNTKSEPSTKRSSRRDKMTGMTLAKDIDLQNSKSDFTITSSSSDSSEEPSDSEYEHAPRRSSRNLLPNSESVFSGSRMPSRKFTKATKGFKSSARKSDEPASNRSTRQTKAASDMAGRIDLQNDKCDQDSSCSDDEDNFVRKPEAVSQRNLRSTKLTDPNSANGTMQNNDSDASISNSDDGHGSTKKSDPAIRRSTRIGQCRPGFRQLLKQVIVDSSVTESSSNEDLSFYSPSGLSDLVTKKKPRKLRKRATRGSLRKMHSTSNQRKSRSLNLVTSSSDENDSASPIPEKPRAYLRKIENAITVAEIDSSPRKEKHLVTHTKSDRALKRSPRKIRNSMEEPATKETKALRTQLKNCLDNAVKIEELVSESEVGGISLDRVSRDEGGSGNIFSHSGRQSKSPEEKIKCINEENLGKFRSTESALAINDSINNVTPGHRKNIMDFKTPEKSRKTYPLRRKGTEEFGDGAGKRKSPTSSENERAVKRQCSASDGKPDVEPEVHDDGGLSDASTILRPNLASHISVSKSSDFNSSQNSPQITKCAEAMQVTALSPDKKMDDLEGDDVHKTKIPKERLRQGKQLAPTKHTIVLLPLTADRMQPKCLEANEALKSVRKRLVLNSATNGSKTVSLQTPAVSSLSNFKHQDESESMDEVPCIASSDLQIQQAENLLLICASEKELTKIRSRAYKHPSMSSLGHFEDSVAPKSGKAHLAHFPKALSKTSDACWLGFPCTIFQRALESAVSCSAADGKPSFGDTLLIIQWLSKMLHLPPAHLLYILRSAENEDSEIAQHS